MPQGKSNNPEGKNQFTGHGKAIIKAAGDVGAKVGGVKESVGFQIQGAKIGAQIGQVAGAAVVAGKTMINEQRGIAPTMSSDLQSAATIANATATGARAGRAVGAFVAKVSPLGEMHGRQQGETMATDALVKARDARNSAAAMLNQVKGRFKSY